MLLQMHVIDRFEPQALCACQRRDAMTLPGFNAETSLYKTSVHYRLMGASVQAGGIVPQQVSVSCGPCYLDNTGACVQNCTICDGHLCHYLGIYSCDPRACPPPHDRCAPCLTLPTDCARRRCDCTCNGGIAVDCNNCPDYPMDCTNCPCHHPANPKCCFVCT